ncbi:MAG: IclR family transcriptional regulator [Deltaproteobacteria bacterium]|nr:IclR family transcriptional regulator [Deltaproteobacteria bacterium]
MRENGHVKSVERGLKILEILGSSSMPLTLTEVSNRAELTITTTQRFINTLFALGYLNRDENKRYALGTKVLSLGFQFLNTSSLVSMARPYLDELSSELEMTVNLTVLDDCDVLILYRSEVRKFLKLDVHAGSKLFAYGSALGRVLLASLDDEDMDRRLNEMNIQQLTEKTIVSKKDNIAEIVKARKNGYVVSDRELTMDLCSIAVPVNNKDNETVAAINVSIDVLRLGDPEVTETAKRKLFEKGRRISGNLGYGGRYPKIFHA